MKHVLPESDAELSPTQALSQNHPIGGLVCVLHKQEEGLAGVGPETEQLDLPGPLTLVLQQKRHSSGDQALTTLDMAILGRAWGLAVNHCTQEMI